MGVFEKIPTFLVVGVLVVIFVQLKRHARTPRLTLWTVGWALTFTHFLAQLLEPENGPASSLLLAIDSASLQAAAVSFLVSVSSVAAEKEDRTRRTLLLILLGLPSVVYMTCAAFQMGARWPYVLCLIAYLAGGGCFFLLARKKFSPYLAAGVVLGSLVGIWAIRAALVGSIDEGRVAL